MSEPEVQVQFYRNSNSMSPQNFEEEAFTVVIQKDLEEKLLCDNFKEITMIQETSSVNNIHVTTSTDCPQLNCCVIAIKDEDTQVKKKALTKLFEKLQILGNMKKSDSVLTILIPEPSVSLVIGSKGRQIRQIQGETNTDILLKKQISGFAQRPVDIKGDFKNVIDAVEQLYKIIQEKKIATKNFSQQFGYKQQLQEFQKSEEGDKVEVQPQKSLTCRFLFPNSLIGFIIGKQGSFTKKLQQEYNVYFKAISEPEYSQNENITILQGKMKNVQESIGLLFKKVEEYITNHDIDEKFIKMLIRKSQVQPLIAEKGQLINEIRNLSQGAQIKILEEEK